MTDQDAFLADMLETLRLTENEFKAYTNEMRAYRDKFVAHLDLDEIMQIPRLRPARQCVAYLHDYVLAHEDDGGFFPEGSSRAARFYQLYVNEGRGVYAE